MKRPPFLAALGRMPRGGVFLRSGLSQGFLDEVGHKSWRLMMVVTVCTMFAPVLFASLPFRQQLAVAHVPTLDCLLFSFICCYLPMPTKICKCGAHSNHCVVEEHKETAPHHSITQPTQMVGQHLPHSGKLATERDFGASTSMSTTNDMGTQVFASNKRTSVYTLRRTILAKANLCLNHWCHL